LNKLILHIGRHKTGTSSLQRFLHINRDRLESHGIYYPVSGATPLAHHDIARHLNARAVLRFSEHEREKHTQAFNNLRLEIANRTDTVLLSSEGFQNCKPKLLARALDSDAVRVIVYIREQVDYLVSAYQQKVHATNYSGSLEEFSDGFGVDYDTFLRRWEDAFDRSNMTVRIYSRKSLKDTDIVSDFCQNIGIPDNASLVRPKGDQNPSIGGSLLELKRRINRFLPAKSTDAKLYRAFSELAATFAHYRMRPLLSQEKVVALREAAATSNLRVFERYPDMTNGFELSSVPTKLALQGNRPEDHEAYQVALDHLAEQSPVVYQRIYERVRAVTRTGSTALSDWWSDLLQQPDMAPNYYG